MHYYIDGYNLLFRMKIAGENLQTMRKLIIEDLNKKVKAIGLSATLVFDSQYQEGDETRGHFNHLEIVYTAQGETADDYILKELKKATKPLQLTVITSDNRLAWRARRRNAKTESVEEFVKWIDKRFRNKLISRKQEVAEKKKVAHTEILLSEPSIEIKAEDCFEYYLEQFEEKFKKLIPESEKPKKTAGKKRRSKRIEEKKEEEPLSDMERWLKLFERESGA